MQLTSLLLTASLAGSSFAAYERSRSVRRGTADVPTVTLPETDKFVVEFAEGTDYEAAVQQVLSRPGAKIVKKFQSDVFTGVSVEVAGDTTDKLQALPAVSTAWRSSKIKLAPPVEMSAFTDGTAVSNYSVHGMTGVDKLHAAGILGKGAKVAIVDTGIEWSHPVLGGGFGPGFKVEGGWDFIGDSNWPDAEKNPDSDPMDVIGHGTHVAGIVAGNGDWFKGVAPEATILAYKVFGAIDYTDDETLIEAFMMAYNDGADIITASIGEMYNWDNNAWAVVASRLVDLGIVVTIAAGNDGEEGPFMASGGANGKNVLSVASVDPSTLIALPLGVTINQGGGSTTSVVPYRPGPYLVPTSFKDLPVYALTLNTSVADDACTSLPPGTPADLSTMAVLVRVSAVCGTDVQMQTLLSANPAAVIFYHNEAVGYGDPWSPFETYMAIIPSDAGEKIVNSLIAGAKATVDFSDDTYYVNMPYGDGGISSFYTSWGALWDLSLKPDIAAPGAAITSTYPPHTYATMSGTSMATPYIAGIAALYIGLHGGRSVNGPGFAKMLHARILSSGSAVPFPGNTDGLGMYLASPTQVGNGLVDAYKVLTYDTQLSLTKFMLNDTHHWSRYQSVDITNNGKTDVTYTFSVQDAATFDSMEDDPKEWLAPVMNDLRGMVAYKLKPDVSFPSGKFVVKAGQTRKAEFTFKIPDLPAGRRSSKLPMLSGKVMIQGSNGEGLSIPYFGLLADVKKEIRALNMFWTGRDWPMIQSGNLKDEWEKPYWNFDVSLYGPTPQDFPVLQVVNIYGSEELRWDVYEANWKERSWKWPPVVGENGYVGSATAWRHSEFFGLDPRTDDPTDVIPLPFYNLERQRMTPVVWLGQLANGSYIAAGNYTMRIAVLLPFGNREASDNWQVMNMPQIKIGPRPTTTYVSPPPAATPTNDPPIHV